MSGDWKIIYTNYDGLQKRAVDFVSSSFGEMLNRDCGIYTIKVLPCIKTFIEPDCNIIVIGTYDESPIICNYINKKDLINNGYIVKISDSKQYPDRKVIIITGDTYQNLFYGAIDFIDDYLPSLAPLHGGLSMVKEVLHQDNLPDFFITKSPSFKTRSVFTWGHPITDFRAYLDNLARLKFNQVIIWNDFLPVNCDEVVDYAHSYGIEVLWGYAWGWRDKCYDGNYMKYILQHLSELKNSVIAEFENSYAHAKGDGIYFQSFTETNQEQYEGTIIAKVVTDFVNDTARSLIALHPNLKIQFGLHAISVHNQLEYIKNIDPNIEILWEDCGSFPYNYMPSFDESEFNRTCDFTDDIINLRKINPMGLVFKGQMTLDWTRFVNQSGPYVLGRDSKEIIVHDEKLLVPIWKVFQAQWLRYGERAYILAKYIFNKTKGNINMCLAGQFSGGIHLPQALCAQMFFDCSLPYDETLEKVAKRSYILM